MIEEGQVWKSLKTGRLIQIVSITYYSKSYQAFVSIRTSLGSHIVPYAAILEQCILVKDVLTITGDNPK
jgi:hypothetical protein